MKAQKQIVEQILGWKKICGASLSITNFRGYLQTSLGISTFTS